MFPLTAVLIIFFIVFLMLTFTPFGVRYRYRLFVHRVKKQGSSLYSITFLCGNWRPCVVKKTKRGFMFTYHPSSCASLKVEFELLEDLVMFLNSFRRQACYRGDDLKMVNAVHNAYHYNRYAGKTEGL